MEVPHIEIYITRDRFIQGFTLEICINILTIISIMFSISQKSIKPKLLPKHLFKMKAQLMMALATIASASSFEKRSTYSGVATFNNYAAQSKYVLQSLPPEGCLVLLSQKELMCL